MEEKPAPVQEEKEIDVPASDLVPTPQQAAEILKEFDLENYGNLPPREALQKVRENLSRLMKMSDEEFAAYLESVDRKVEAEITELVTKVAAKIKKQEQEAEGSDTKSEEITDIIKFAVADRVKVSKIPLLFSETARAFFGDHDLIGRGELQIPTGLEDDEGNEITNIVSVEHIAKDGAVKIEGGSFSEYEQAITNAYFSIVQAAELNHKRPMFTLEDLHAVMPGSSDHPGEAQKKDMLNALETLQSMKTTIDATKELERRGYKGSAIIRENFFSHRQITMVTANNKKTEVFIPLSKPPLLEHGERSGQIQSIQVKYFKIQEVVNGKPNGNAIRMNKPRQAMANYIIHRIAEMKRSKSLKRKILFSTLYKQTGLTDDDTVQKKRHREFIREMLDYERAVGFISDYQLITKGPFAQRGILITLPSDRKQIEDKK